MQLKGAVNAYAESIEEVINIWETSKNGLTASSVEERLKKYGKNQLPVKKPKNLLIIFVSQFLNPLIYFLIAAAFISLFNGEVKDAGFIFAVLLLNAIIGTIQEANAEKRAAALQNLIKIRVRTRRNGEEKEIDSMEVVPGDVVLLEAGVKVPADIRLFEANNITVDESLLTGESVSVGKNTEVCSTNLPVNEQKNMLFAGSIINTGKGAGITVATGLNTEIGEIAKTITQGEDTKTALIVRMEKFSKQISIIIISFCALIVVLELIKGNPFKEVFMIAVALAVSAIPEGLPVALTVALSIATSRMAKRNVVVRKLNAVESLGSCTFIASDKTGTLTVNQQTAKVVYLPPDGVFKVSGEGYNGSGSIIITGEKDPKEKHKSLSELISAAIISNDGSLTLVSDQWKYFGDQVDVAFLALAYKHGIIPEQLRKSMQIVAEIPYESERRFGAKFYKDKAVKKVALKGAVETVLGFCEKMAAGDTAVNIDEKMILAEAEKLSGDGYRVIAVASGEYDNLDAGSIKEKDIPSLVLLGLVGFIDPPRAEVKGAINECKSAGIAVAMVTGDHPVTAFAVAKQLGIADSFFQVLTGKDLEGIPKNELSQKIKDITVFARVTPLQKYTIVEALMKLGHFVAVTGDGVNDAPALKKAHIGVAMGSGTDVAKETAAMIITDDNFVSIVSGVEEGRFAYDNVRKVIFLLISTGGAELLLFLLALIFSLPFPLFAVQLLWLNLVTNGIQAAALAFEGGEKEAMKRKPRDPKEGIFNGLMVREITVSSLIIGTVVFGAWFYLIKSGVDEGYSRNLILLFLVLLENFHVFNCRSEYKSAFKIPIKNNYFLIAGVVLLQAVHIASMHIPFMQKILGVSHVSMKEWLVFAALSSLILWGMEIFKAKNRSISH